MNLRQLGATSWDTSPPNSKINQDTTEWFFELGRLDDNNLQRCLESQRQSLWSHRKTGRERCENATALLAAQRVLSIIEPNGGFSCKPRLMTPEGT